MTRGHDGHSTRKQKQLGREACGAPSTYGPARCCQVQQEKRGFQKMLLDDEQEMIMDMTFKIKSKVSHLF